MTDPSVHRFAGRDGVELPYRELGRGRPLVLCHGFLGDGRQWLDLGPASRLAAAGHRVILPDLRAHGASAAPREPAAYPPDVLADDGLALLEHLGLADVPGGYDLGGWSLGGRIALRLLARGARPGRAIVGDQGLDGVTEPSARTGGLRRVLSALARDEPLAPGTPDAELASWITRGGADPAALLSLLDSLVTTPPATLAAIPTPTLVVVGDRDERRVEALADALPAGRLVRVPGDHATALGAPELATELVTFLGREADRS